MLSAERRDVQAYGGGQGGMPCRVAPIFATDKSIWLTRVPHGYILAHMIPLMHAISD